MSSRSTTACLVGGGSAPPEKVKAPGVAKSRPKRKKVITVSKFVSGLYKLARTTNDVETLASGNPTRIARRAKNKLIGRKVVSKLFRWH
jgi:hypothetical protein